MRLSTVFVLVSLVLAILLVNIQHVDAGRQKRGLSGIDKHAPAEEKKLSKASRNIRDGYYRLRNAKTGRYITFFSKGNNINMESSHRHGGSDLGAKGQEFRIAHHKNKRFPHLYSIHRPNHSGRDKCISAGYSRNADIYSIMYMCRVETKNGGGGGVTSPGSNVKYDKQLWMFIPASHGTFKIVALAHLDMTKPRCIYPKHREGYGAMAPHHYRGLALDECKFDNNKGKIFNWHLERVR
jgi:hypothetical protein